MNLLLKSYVLSLFVLITCTIHSQCPNTNTYSGIDMGTPPCGTFNYANVQAGEYVLVDVVTGVRYQFTLCGASFDTQMTGYPDAGGSDVFFNDDGGALCAGTASSVDWTAPFTGKLRILVNTFYCVGGVEVASLGVSIVNVISWASPAGNGQTINRCLSSNNLTLSTTPSGGIFSGNGVISGNLFSPSAAGIGLHELIYEVANCTQSIFINVTPDLAVGNITGGSSSICTGGDPNIMTVTPTGGSGTYSYQWFQEDGANCPLVSGSAIPTTNNASYDPPSGLITTRTYRVRVISSSAGGCSATLFSDNCITVNVHSNPPTPIITGNSSFCSGGSTTLSAPAGYTYLWSTGETSQTINVSTAGNYTVTIDDGNGCTATSDPFDVTVSAPTTYITHPLQSYLCPNDITLTPTNSSDNYLWSPNGETTQSITISYPTTYTVTISDNNNCIIAVEEFEIAGVGIPLIFHPAQILCSEDILTPTNTANSYKWTPNGETTQSISVTSSGVYRVTLIGADGCDIMTERFPVTVRPVINANIDIDFCTASTTVTLTGGSPEDLGDNYIITNNGSGTFNGLPITHNGTFTVSDLTNGDYVIFTAEDSYGCGYDFEQFVAVDASAPVVTCPGPQPIIPLTDCEGIMPDYTGLITATDACNYTITQVNPIPGTNLSPGQSSNVLFSIIDEMGNARFCSFLYNVATDTEAPNAVCQDINVNISILGTAEFTFTDLDGGSTDNCGINYVSLSNTIFNCSDIGDNIVTVTIYDNIGNSGTCQSTITVINPYITTASAGLDTTICYSENIELNGSFGGGATGGYWTTSGDGSFDDADFPNATYTHTLNDLANSPIHLVYHTTGGVCDNTSDTIELTIVHIDVSSIGGTNPTTCGGNDGYITFLLNTPFSTFNISYEVNGLVTNISLTTDNGGIAYLTGLAAGTYTILSVEQYGCFADDLSLWNDVILTDPSSLNIYVSSINPSICNANDGSITINGNGSLLPNTNYSNLSYFDGTSTITIPSFTTDAFGNYVIPNIGGGTYSNFELDVNGCLAAFNNTPITVTNPILPEPFINYSQLPLCESDVITLTAIPYGGSSITWYDPSDLMTPITTGLTYSPTVHLGINTYCITNSINGCESNPFCLDVVNVFAYPNPPLMVDTTFCEGTTISLQGISSSGGIVYFYSDAALTNLISTSDLLLTGSMTGTHTFYATEEVASCMSSPVEFTISFIDCSPPCTAPMLTTGSIECNSSTNTYTVYFHSSSSSSSTISTSAGIINNLGLPYSITDIPFGTDVTITASSGLGCDVSQTITALPGCPTNCNLPELSVGQGVCQGNGEYSIAFSETTGAVVTSSIGTILGNTIIDIPVGSQVTVTATNGSCTTSTIIESPIDCNDPCFDFPISISNGVCMPDGTYSINFTAAPGAIITSTHGIINGNQITNIPSGQDINITVSVPGCNSVGFRAIKALNCPSCTNPVLTMGPITCNATNNTYGISYFTSTGAIVTTNTGTVIGNTVINVPFGTDLTITSSVAGGCETVQTVTGLTNCPVDCVYPNLTTGQGVCQGSGLYSISFSETTGAVISISVGTILGNTITNIPVGTNVVVTATNGNCEMSATIESPANCSVPCINPILSIDKMDCDDVNGTYSISYSSNAPITATAGTITPSHVVDIPFGVNVTITAINGPGCEVSQTIIGLNECPDGSCTTPDLSTFQGACADPGFYNVAIIESTGAIITSSAGVPMGGVVVDIPIGTDVTITATNGTCVVTRIISSPDCSVIDPCTNPTISLGGPVCASDGSPFYSVDYVVSSNVTGGWSNVGTITPNSIINIPSGTDLILGLEVSGCNTTIINIPSLNCPQCEKPTLTTGPTVCNATNDTYSVSFNSDADAASVTASAGTILGNTVTDIPFGTDVTITASNGLGCEVSQTITGLTNCPVDCEYPNLTVGKAVCQGNNTYSFTFSSNGSVTKTTAGIITGNTVTNIPIGTDVVISAENDNCINVLTVLSPANCLDFEIPTAFTPNGDGVNDYWEIPGLKELYPYNVVRIYNRWGNLLFESNGYDIPWNGKYNGEDLPVASYYFIIELNDEVQEAHTGTVTIMKKN